MSLENVRIKGTMYPWYLKIIFFHLSTSKVFMYKVFIYKVAPKYMHWEAVWHHVKSMTWEPERPGSVPT